MYTNGQLEMNVTVTDALPGSAVGETSGWAKDKYRLPIPSALRSGGKSTYRKFVESLNIGESYAATYSLAKQSYRIGSELGRKFIIRMVEGDTYRVWRIE